MLQSSFLYCEFRLPILQDGCQKRDKKNLSVRMLPFMEFVFSYLWVVFIYFILFLFICFLNLKCLNWSSVTKFSIYPNIIDIYSYECNCFKWR